MNFDPDIIEDSLDSRISKIKEDTLREIIFGDYIEKTKGNFQFVRVETRKDLDRLKDLMSMYEGQMFYVLETRKCFVYSNGEFSEIF